MKTLVQAITMALGTLGFAAAAHAGTYVVTANSHALDAKLARKIEAAGGTITARLPQIGVAIVQSDYNDFAARAAKIPGVHSAVSDFVMKFEQPQGQETIQADFANPPNSGDNDAFFDLQWGHAAIDAAGAWNAGHRGAGATVAVLDSGLYCQHQDIAPNLIGGASFVPSEPNFCNTAGSSHGTHVAGTILAVDNGVGTIGVAPESKLLAVKVLSAATGSGSFAGIIQGIVYAADNGADVINMSLGVRGGLPVNGQGANDVRELINATARATRYARSQNAIIVVSAGNDGRDLDKDSSVRVCDAGGENCFNQNLMAFPAQLPGVLSISALAPLGWAKTFTNENLDLLASYSSFGITGVSHSAPGGDFDYPGGEACSRTLTNGQVIRVPCWVFDMVLSTTTGTRGYSWNAGTSMAAPHVSGVAALIVGKHGGDLAPAQVERILRASADDLGDSGKDPIHGFGRVNAARAVSN
ncbi:MAG: S8 family serine peptidase [Pseudomonadota bacterium]|nr:S8 family serine peptidase [Pseudomonadota bacterium]